MEGLFPVDLTHHLRQCAGPTKNNSSSSSSTERLVVYGELLNEDARLHSMKGLGLSGWKLKLDQGLGFSV